MFQVPGGAAGRIVKPVCVGPYCRAGIQLHAHCLQITDNAPVFIKDQIILARVLSICSLNHATSVNGCNDLVR